jgi:hypothetical protein
VAVTREAALEASRRLGVSEQEFARVEKRQRERSSGATGPADAFWEVANAALERYVAARDWDGAGVVYHAQARWLYEHEPDHDHADLQRLAHEARIVDLRSRRHHRRVAIEAPCCGACDARDGEEFSFARALEESPLPNEACTLRWCTCSWRGIPNQ